MSVIIDHGTKIETPAPLLVQKPPDKNIFLTELYWSSLARIFRVALLVVLGKVEMYVTVNVVAAI